MNKRSICFIDYILIGVSTSCKKDEVSENCYVCSNEVDSVDVYEENVNFVIDGEVIANENGATIKDLIRAVEVNPKNDPDLEGISCRRK